MSIYRKLETLTMFFWDWMGLANAAIHMSAWTTSAAMGHSNSRDNWPFANTVTNAMVALMTIVNCHCLAALGQRHTLDP